MPEISWARVIRSQSSVPMYSRFPVGLSVTALSSHFLSSLVCFRRFVAGCRLASRKTYRQLYIGQSVATMKLALVVLLFLGALPCADAFFFELLVCPLFGWLFSWLGFTFCEQKTITGATSTLSPTVSPVVTPFCGDGIVDTALGEECDAGAAMPTVSSFVFMCSNTTRDHASDIAFAFLCCWKATCKECMKIPLNAGDESDDSSGKSPTVV